MSPLEIEILLWYRARGTDFRDGDFRAPAVREAIDRFRDKDDLLEKGLQTPGSYAAYRLTDRGNAFVAAILALPLPICRWEIPEAEAA